MKTIDIKGKSYVQVNERLKYFRENYPGHALRSQMLANLDGVCIFKAIIFDADERPIANGHAYEKEGSTFINKTSYIENCETSAWGRALGNFGIGIDEAVASSDEVQNAIKQQGKPDNPQPPEGFEPVTDEQKAELLQILIDAGLKQPGTNLTMKDAKKYGVWETSAPDFDKVVAELNRKLAAGEEI